MKKWVKGASTILGIVLALVISICILRYISTSESKYDPFLNQYMDLGSGVVVGILFGLIIPYKAEYRKIVAILFFVSLILLILPFVYYLPFLHIPKEVNCIFDVYQIVSLLLGDIYLEKDNYFSI